MEKPLKWGKVDTPDFSTSLGKSAKRADFNFRAARTATSVFYPNWTAKKPSPTSSETNLSERFGSTFVHCLPKLNVIKSVTKKAARALPIIGPYLRRVDKFYAMLGHLPGHYYSPIPDFLDIQARESELWAKPAVQELTGIDLNEQSQLRLLEELAEYHAAQPFPEYKRSDLRYYFANDFFSFSDAIFYYSMLRHLKPRRVIEVGSGFSSCVLLDTNQRFLDSTVSCTFIDPDPTRLFSLLQPDDAKNIEVLPERLQRVDPKLFSELTAGDILFVDSSHVSKTGSEVHQLYFNVFPALKSGVHIHIHDVFYPFEYPKEYVHQHWGWNELYLLRAFLYYNKEFRITIFPSFLEQLHGERLRTALPIAWKHPPKWATLRGASFWMQRI